MGSIHRFYSALKFFVNVILISSFLNYFFVFKDVKQDLGFERAIVNTILTSQQELRFEELFKWDKYPGVYDMRTIFPATLKYNLVTIFRPVPY